MRGEGKYQNENQRTVDYKYTLEKYTGMKSRHTCPSCNKRGQFTRYVNTETGEYLGDHVGRCNREDQCAYHYTPKQYFADNPGTRTFDSSLSRPMRAATPPQPRPTSFDTIPFGVLKKSLALMPKSNFHGFLSKSFGDDVSKQQSNKFLFATSLTEEKATIFWQFDINQQVRSGKIIHYDPVTGKRGKYINWVHSLISRHTGKPLQLKQCFYGENQLATDTKSPVANVESEKTAIISNILMPEYLWLATGGVSGCGWRDKNVASVLLGRDVTLFPDLGMYERWYGYSIDLQNQLPLKLHVSDLLERVSTQAEREEKSGFD